MECESAHREDFFDPTHAFSEQKLAHFVHWEEADPTLSLPYFTPLHYHHYHLQVAFFSPSALLSPRPLQPAYSCSCCVQAHRPCVPTASGVCEQYLRPKKRDQTTNLFVQPPILSPRPMEGLRRSVRLRPRALLRRLSR